MDFKKEIEISLKKELKQEIELEIPPDPKLGDYSFPCFNLAKKLKKDPKRIAEELSKKVRGSFDTKVIGPYLNFFINKNKLAKIVFVDISKKKDRYGCGKEKERIIIEYPSPNTNKPLHLGHVRNILTGQTMSNILRFLGNKVYEINLNNDRGIHICKSMLAYKKWGENKKPDMKSDHFVGKYYVMYNKKKTADLEKEAYDMLNKWEKGDKKTRSLWKKMNKWALKGFDETYKKFNLKFNKVYNENEIYDKGKKIILEGVKKRIFYKEKDGSICANLDLWGLGKKVLLRPDRTSIYITQDIYLAKVKYDNFKMNKSVYVVASEQNYHFQVLFRLLKMLNYPFADGCYHLNYGMVYLPEGKMKSREGLVVDADDIVEEVEDLAKAEINLRYKGMSDREVKKRSFLIGMAGLRFHILKFDVRKDITYDPKEVISFEGETGPYIQYTHARICSILRKFKGKNGKVRYNDLNEDDISIIKLLSEFGEVVLKSGKDYKPHLICRYLLNLSQLFNNYYVKYPVLKADKKDRDFRIVLIKCVKQVLKNGLNLLGIEALERM